MAQRDYILRLIEELGAALIELRNAILGGKASGGEVEDTLRRAASAAGMDIELARALSVEVLPAMVAPTGEVEPARCWVLAEALMTDGVHRLRRSEHGPARSSLAKAAALFDLVGTGDGSVPGFPEARVRIAEIEELLDGIGED